MGWLWGSTSDSKENTSKSYENSYESESSYDISPATSISDTLHSGFDGELAHGSAAAGDADLQKFLLHEQQKAQLQAMVRTLKPLLFLRTQELKEHYCIAKLPQLLLQLMQGHPAGNKDLGNPQKDEST